MHITIHVYAENLLLKFIQTSSIENSIHLLQNCLGNKDLKQFLPNFNSILPVPSTYSHIYEFLLQYSRKSPDCIWDYGTSLQPWLLDEWRVWAWPWQTASLCPHVLCNHKKCQGHQYKVMAGQVLIQSLTFISPLLITFFTTHIRENNVQDFSR